MEGSLEIYGGGDLDVPYNYSIVLVPNTTTFLYPWNTTNSTNTTMKLAVSFAYRHGLMHIITTSIILGLIILCTIIGNVFVVAAIILERNLQSVSNYLILSLAVADLMVATLVMPISALNEVSERWWLGLHLCDVWTCFDVLCCTASILHLVAIAIDRYWAVTNVDYIRVRTAKRIVMMIAIVWVISIVISIPARYYFASDTQKKAVRTAVLFRGECNINNNIYYTIFSTVGAFYLPMLFMIGIYIKIYQAARARIRKKAFKAKMTNTPASNKKEKKKKNKGYESTVSNTPEDSQQETQPNQQTTSFTVSSENHVTRLKENGKETPLLNHSPSPNRVAPPNNALSLAARAAAQRDKLEHRRERKAARTLAIITSCFLVCWMPFFIRALICPFTGNLCRVIPDHVNSFFLWLGYMNSLLNPVIYTIFSPDFRNAFRKILFGRYHRPGFR